MLRRIAILIVVLGCSGAATARAQDAPPADASQMARDLAAVLTAATIAEQAARLADEAWPRLEAELRRQHPTIDGGTLAELRKDFERLQFVAIVEGLDDAAAVYARYLSIEEMRAMIAFYRTPAGAKALAVLPRTMMDSMDALAARLKSTHETLAAALAEMPADGGAIPDAIRQRIDAEKRQREAALLLAKLAAQPVAIQESSANHDAAADAAAAQARLKKILEEAARRRQAAVGQFNAHLQAAREQLKAKAAAEAAKKAGLSAETGQQKPAAAPATPAAKPPPVIAGKKAIAFGQGMGRQRTYHQRWNSRRVVGRYARGKSGKWRRR